MEHLMHSSHAFHANVCRISGLLQYQNWCQYSGSGESTSNICLNQKIMRREKKEIKTIITVIMQLNMHTTHTLPNIAPKS